MSALGGRAAPALVCDGCHREIASDVIPFRTRDGRVIRTLCPTCAPVSADWSPPAPCVGHCGRWVILGAGVEGRYCSTLCGDRARCRRKRAREWPELTCGGCGAPYQQRREAQKSCGNARCRLKVWREKQRTKVRWHYQTADGQPRHLTMLSAADGARWLVTRRDEDAGDVYVIQRFAADEPLESVQLAMRDFVRTASLSRADARDRHHNLLIALMTDADGDFAERPFARGRGHYVTA